MQGRFVKIGMLGMLCFSAHAMDIDIGGINASSKSRLSVGVAIRTESPDPDLIGKLNLNPGLCDPSCISFSGDPSLNASFVEAPGAFFGSNKDNGNLNYDQWDVVAAIARADEDITIRWKDLTLKAGVLAYFDPANDELDNRHPDTTYQPPKTPRNSAVKRKLVKDVLLKEANISGFAELFGHEVSATVGYQQVRWGESTYVALNSLNQINPPSQTLMRQPGTAIGDIFRPVPAIQLNSHLTPNLSLDLIYELGWKAVSVDPNGSFYSAYDVINGDYFTLGVGQFNEDPLGLATLPPPADSISDSAATGTMVDNIKPRNSGQLGLRLSYYASELNGGTDISFYALNYHSQLPYFSVIAADQSCARTSRSFVQAFFDCDGFIGLNPESGREPIPIDTLKGLFEYPEDIQMYGISFNTNAGAWSVAGEYSIRPNMPLQVHIYDVAFAGLQPAFPERDLALGADPMTLLQTAASLGGIVGSVLTSNPTELLQEGVTFLTSLPTILRVIGMGGVRIPSSRTFVPDYLSAYRGLSVQAGDLIHGYERFTVDQIDVTALRSFGSAQNPFGADQVLLLAEVGLTHVWNMPSRNRLQIEGGDANDTHASPGADGSGWAPGTSANVYSRGLNPTQQTKGFATEFSGGYRLQVQLEYDNVFWGLNFKPAVFWGHDVYGIAPQPIQNFIEGTKSYVVGTTIESGAHWSGQIFYQGSFGGGTVNTLKDRDVVALTLAYTF